MDNKPKHRKEHLTEAIKNYAGDFFARNSSGGSLITVTNVFIYDDMKNADIFISVLPESKSEAALNFAKRQRTELQKYVYTKIRVHTLPFFDILLDKTERMYAKVVKLKK
jgi:ribosome-binding factor A